MGIALVVVGSIFLLVSGYGLVRYLHAFVKDKKNNELDKKTRNIWLAGVAGFGVGGGLLSTALMYGFNWKVTPRHATMVIIGQTIFFAAFALIATCFYVRYWKPTTEEKALKKIKIGLFGSIPLLIIFGILALEGMAPYCDAPYVSGFLIDGEGFHWVYAARFIKNAQGDFVRYSGGFHMAWYALFIVFGALVCYWISDHKFYKEFKKHGIVDNVLLLAFPAGIIGARIGYVIGNWEKDGFNTNFAAVFRIWDGGLTILAGAVVGILVGALYVMRRRKYVDIRWAADVVVPTILLAQAIGRWGNFFNAEVYGNVVALNQGWSWLPSFISNQMVIDAPSSAVTVGFLPAGYIHVPLFLVEGLFNVAGYFIIVYGIPKLWKKGRPNGSLTGFYLIWYGILRAILENFRTKDFRMGNNDLWSNINSYLYIAAGVILIIAFMLYDRHLVKIGKPTCRNHKPTKKVKKVIRKVVVKKPANQQNFVKGETSAEKLEEKPIESTQEVAENVEKPLEAEEKHE